jgi:hypothetical protein
MEQQQNTGMTPLVPELDQAQIWRDYRDNPIGFEEAYQKVLGHHDADGNRQDIQITALRSWAFGPAPDSQHMAIWQLPIAGRKNVVALPLRQNAWSQLCGKLSLPAEYVGRLPAKLQMACVNWDMAQHSKDAFARMAGGSVRALLSARYAPIDDGHYLQVVSDVLGEAGYRNDARVRVVAAGPNTVLRVTIPTGAKMVRGQAMEFGIDIGNSELGLRSVQVTPVTYNLVCTNGMRAWRSEATHRLRHVGDPSRLQDALKDAVPVAFAEASGDLNRWQKATESMIDNALAEIESLRSFGFTKPERESIGKQLVADSDLTGPSFYEALKGASTTVFDVANAITAVGKGRGQDDDGMVKVEARLRFEDIGHDYLLRRTA